MQLYSRIVLNADGGHLDLQGLRHLAESGCFKLWINMACAKSRFSSWHLPLQAGARLVERQSIAQHAALQLLRLVTAGNNEAAIAQPMQIRFKQQWRIEHHSPLHPARKHALHNIPYYLGANSCVFVCVEFQRKYFESIRNSIFTCHSKKMAGFRSENS
jgi:hypothetical protein